MANTNTKKIVGAGSKRKKKSNRKLKKKYTAENPTQFSSLDREQRALRGVKSKGKGYVSSYLDLSADTPGKYGVDY